MIIDAHHHVWDPGSRRHQWLADLPALQRRFDLDDFAEISAVEQIDASVLVQVLADTSETEEFLALADGGNVVAAVVGWADLAGPDVATEIARLRGMPGGDRLAGIRHLVQDEPDPGWLDRPEVRRGLRAVGAAGLCYDLLVRPGQLAAALRVTGDLDDVGFILDHGGKPAIGTGLVEPWARQVAELARRPNVTCKLSGLVTEAGPGWEAGQIGPYADWLLDCFGPDRLMFGSDWPVCTLAATYGQVVALARTLLGGRLSAEETNAVFGQNAAAVYDLRPPGN
jgi:L-fuconolactonase